MAVPILKEPADLPTTATKTQTRIWEKKVAEHIKREIYLQENLKTLYFPVWGQCIDVPRAWLEALENHNEMSDRADSITLLKAIKALVFNFHSQKYGRQALHESKRMFY
jgi:hypothetical protein